MTDPEFGLHKLKDLLSSDPGEVSEDLRKFGETFEPSVSAVELLANACRSRMHWLPYLAIKS